MTVIENNKKKKVSDVRKSEDALNKIFKADTDFKHHVEYDLKIISSQKQSEKLNIFVSIHWKSLTTKWCAIPPDRFKSEPLDNIKFYYNFYKKFIKPIPVEFRKIFDTHIKNQSRTEKMYREYLKLLFPGCGEKLCIPCGVYDIFKKLGNQREEYNIYSSLKLFMKAGKLVDIPIKPEHVVIAHKKHFEKYIVPIIDELSGEVVCIENIGVFSEVKPLIEALFFFSSEVPYGESEIKYATEELRKSLCKFVFGIWFNKKLPIPSGINQYIVVCGLEAVLAFKLLKENNKGLWTTNDTDDFYRARYKYFVEFNKGNVSQNLNPVDSSYNTEVLLSMEKILTSELMPKRMWSLIFSKAICLLKNKKEGNTLDKKLRVKYLQYLRTMLGEELPVFIANNVDDGIVEFESYCNANPKKLSGVKLGFPSHEGLIGNSWYWMWGKDLADYVLSQTRKSIHKKIGAIFLAPMPALPAHGTKGGEYSRGRKYVHKYLLLAWRRNIPVINDVFQHVNGLSPCEISVHWASLHNKKSSILGA